MCGEGPFLRGRALPSPKIHRQRRVRDVWRWNFHREFDEFMHAAANAGAGSIVALDTEFAGFLYKERKCAAWEMRYQALRANVEVLRPIQIGFAISNGDGVLQGVWSFNLLFNADSDCHTEDSLQFLMSAGMNIPRHALEGIDPRYFGRLLSKSALFRNATSDRAWLTFSGAYDLAYLLKILTARALPQEPSAFDAALLGFCPRRFELQDSLPLGSLDCLLRQHGVERSGLAHTAGSDALATLDLYLNVAHKKLVHAIVPGVGIPKKASQFSKVTSGKKIPARPDEQRRLVGPTSAPQFCSVTHLASDDRQMQCTSLHSASKASSASGSRRQRSLVERKRLASPDREKGTALSKEGPRANPAWSRESDSRLHVSARDVGTRESEQVTACDKSWTRRWCGLCTSDILMMVCCILIFNCLTVVINMLMEPSVAHITEAAEQAVAQCVINS